MSDVSQREGDQQSPRFYTVPEAAAMLRMSTVTLYRSIGDGEFPAVRVRGRIAVPAKAIDEMEATAVETGSAVNAADWVHRTDR